MRQLALQTIKQNFPQQLNTAYELLDSPLQPRRSYHSTDFDRNFALLNRYGLAITVPAPTFKSQVELYYLCADEVIALNCRSLVAYYLPPLFSQFAARGSGCAADFTQQSRATPAEEIAQLYYLGILSRTKLFRLKKQALSVYMQANGMAFDARTRYFVVRSQGQRRSYAATPELCEFFMEQTIAETDLMYVDFCVCKKFLNLYTSVQLLRSVFDDVFAATVLNAVTMCSIVQKPRRFSIQDFCANARDSQHLGQFQHITEQLKQPAVAQQFLQFAAAAGFVMQIGELYEPYLDCIVQFAQQKIGAKMLLARDVSQGRIVGLLFERGALDEAQIAYEAAMTLPDAQKAANHLFKEGFLSCSRSGETFLFYIHNYYFLNNCAAMQAGALARLIYVQDDASKDLRRAARVVFLIVYVMQSLMIFM